MPNWSLSKSNVNIKQNICAYLKLNCINVISKTQHRVVNFADSDFWELHYIVGLIDSFVVYPFTVMIHKIVSNRKEIFDFK